MNVQEIKVPEKYFPLHLKKAKEASFFQSEIHRSHIENRNFPAENRKVLVEVLSGQYAAIEDFQGSETEKNIRLLAEENTFTVCTGQQIHLFLGPLYVLYKIAGTIALSHELSETYPGYNFVPVFWMATEDHDFAEISTIDIFNRRFQWEILHGGPVGRLPVDSLDNLLAEMESMIKDPAKLALWQDVSNVYQAGRTLAESTRILVQQWFGEYGLVCIDPDNGALKSLFAPIMQEEILSGQSAAALRMGSEKLQQQGITPTALVRNVNLFMLESGIRKRLDKEGEIYRCLPGDTNLSDKQLLTLLVEAPENFSPNVLLRPLYQELILPNLAYIAGPSEYIYWCQTSAAFEHTGIPKPALIQRKSIIWPDKKSSSQMEKLSVPIEHYWLDEELFRQEILNKIQQKNPYDELLDSWTRLADETADVMQRTRNADLRSFRQAVGAMMKTLKSGRSQYLQVLENDSMLGAPLRQAKRIRERYFSPSHPQERYESILSLVLENKDSIQNAIEAHKYDEVSLLLFSDSS